MASDGQIVFEVTADGKHAIADVREITKAIQQETKQWDSATKTATDGMGASFSSMLKKVVGGFGALKLGKELLQLGKDAISAASDLREVQNVVDTTFGGNASKIETWAKSAGTQFGLTETQAKRFTSTLGAMMKSSGLAGNEIVDMSTDLAGLAADMASFYNLDFDTAFQKIRSGISGETEPLKQLGINMSVANLNAYALQQGLSKTFEQMTQGEQTMLRYQYIMSATADAQGDFARTSDEYANGMRMLETNLANIKTNLGNVLLDVVNPLLTGVNSLFEEKGTKTVLDDFAGIDAETEQKLERIRTAAGSARELTEELERIGGGKASQAGAKVQGIVDGLSKIDLDQGKAGIVKDFVSTLAANIDTLAALKGTDAEGAKEWLEGIAESANKLDPADAEGWATLMASIKEGLPGLENTDFGAAFFAALGGGFADVGQKSSVLQWTVDTLGNKTNRTAEEQAYWLEVCKQLVKTIPGLSSIINTETGEIKGGTQAVKDYIKAWEEGQTKLVLLGAIEEKESALSTRFADLPGLQLDKALAEKHLRDRQKEYQDLLDKYGLEKFNTMNKGSAMAVQLGLSDDAVDELNEAHKAFHKARTEVITTTAAYDEQKKALDEAKQALIEYRQTVDEMPGTIEETVDANEEWIKSTGKTREQITEIVSAAQDAVAAMHDYAQGVQESMLQAVDSVASSLDRVDYQAYGKQIEKITELTEKQTKTKVGSDEWKQLQTEIDKANESLVSTNSIFSNLESQAQFLDSYLANLQKARSMGLSDALLSQLSDGSVESAEYLDAIVNDKTGKTAADIDAKYQEIQEKKAALAQELAGQQLKVDQTYQSLADKAKEAVTALDLGEEANANAGKTIEGMADGIASHIPEVKEAVDGIIDQLNRLNGFGINIDFGGFGSIVFNASTSKAETSGRFGVDYVPRDDYLIRAHEGERLLTAQENQIWNTLLRGGEAGFSLDDLGGAMRDNIQPGGNVYLDGKEVGRVMSAQQGKQYRQLQRSGWQR